MLSDDFDIPNKSTDDFHTYNQPEEDVLQKLMDEFVEVGKLSQGERDGHSNDDGPWGFDPFGPDADVWRSIAE
jgi:hypothetical protein